METGPAELQTPVQEQGVIVHSIIPALGRLRQEDKLDSREPSQKNKCLEENNNKIHGVYFCFKHVLLMDDPTRKPGNRGVIASIGLGHLLWDQNAFKPLPSSANTRVH